jgi:hypothetical protein
MNVVIEQAGDLPADAFDHLVKPCAWYHRTIELVATPYL